MPNTIPYHIITISPTFQMFRDFSMNQAQVPLGVRIELQHSIELTELILPGVILQTIFCLYETVALTTFRYIMETVQLEPHWLFVILQVSFLIPMLLTLSVQPILILWKMRKQDSKKMMVEVIKKCQFRFWNKKSISRNLDNCF